MNNKRRVKLGLLAKKINEYFAKKPNAKSVIFKMELGGDKTHWKVTRNEGKLSIVEVISKKKEFIVEQPIGQRENDIEQTAYAAGQQAGADQAAQQQVAPQPVAPPPGGAIPPIAPVGAPPVGPAMAPGVGEIPLPDMPMAPPPGPGGVAPPADPSTVHQAADVVRAAGQSPDQGVAQAAQSETGATGDVAAQLPDAQLLPNMDPGKGPNDREGEKIEAGFDPLSESLLNEASPGYAAASQAFMQFMQTQMRETAVAFMQAYKNALLSVTDPAEKQGLQQMYQTVAPFVGRVDTQQQRTDYDTMMQNVPYLNPMQGLRVDHKEYTKRVLREAYRLIKEQDPTFKKKDLGRPDFEPGLEVEPAQPDQEPVEVPFQPGVSEESALVRGLKGQAIKDVKFVNDEDTLQIELKLATTDWPATFEFNKDGKLTFIMKDRRYVLHKKWI